jgi:DHA1 family multidrug resistance protein-like MFS transporter
MIPMAIGGVIFAAGLFCYAWTSHNHVKSWVACSASFPVDLTVGSRQELIASFIFKAIFLGFIGCGVLLLFLQAINAIVDTYLRFANSAMAASKSVHVSTLGMDCLRIRQIPFCVHSSEPASRFS